MSEMSDLPDENAPYAARVAMRALATSAVVCRGYMEGDALLREGFAGAGLRALLGNPGYLKSSGELAILAK